jgi:hypothetical protein
MGRFVWKYHLPIRDEVVLQMPAGAQIRAIQCQGVRSRAAHLWALVDADAPGGSRRLQVRRTGHKADDLGPHLATFHLDDGLLVFHVFDGGWIEPEAQL